MTFLKYDIISDYSPSALVKKVEATIAKGWKPLGGVASSGTEKLQFHQAMTMEVQMPVKKKP